MMFTADELKVIKSTLFMEWEMRGGVVWTVDGVSIPELYKKIERIIDEI